MKRMSLTITVIAASFLLGFAFKTILSDKKNTKMKKVTGIGGIFFKCKDPKAINEWYKTHLGFDTSPYGTSFEWRQIDDSTKKGLTQWNPFAENTKYFEPFIKSFVEGAKYFVFSAKGFHWVSPFLVLSSISRHSKLVP